LSWPENYEGAKEETTGVMANTKVYFRRVVYEIPEEVVPVKQFCYGCVMPDIPPCHCDVAYERAIKEVLVKLKLICRD
jgi:hypothetical protein